MCETELYEYGNLYHTNAYTMSNAQINSSVRVTSIGLAFNMAIAIAKFIGDCSFNSNSIIADAWHGVTDLASDILTLATVHWSLQEPNDRFPLGFGKVESLGSLGVSGILLAGGCYVGWENVISLHKHLQTSSHVAIEYQNEPFQTHSKASLVIPDMHAVWIVTGTIVIKELLYHASKSTGPAPLDSR
ncbi:Mitochondrial metal transporter 2 [Ilyonectria robusta]